MCGGSQGIVSKRVREEDPEVQAIMQAGAQEVPWVSEELGTVALGDKRLDRRLIKTAEKLTKSPSSPINEACGNWACAKAAYRLFDNKKASAAAIIKPHIEATQRRMASQSGPVLIIQDTVFFHYAHPNAKGLGPIGKSQESSDRGLIMHNALAFSTSGVPLGILSQKVWARDEVPEETREEKVERLQCTAIEEKESFKWIEALRETAERAPKGVKVITLADRESDFYEFIAEAKAQRGSFIIRARFDRQLVPEESAGHDNIVEALRGSPSLGELTVDIPGNGKRKARSATVTVRAATVTLKAPQKRGRARDSATLDPITVNVVGATEEHPPEGVEAISWVLLTDLPVSDFEAAAEKVKWYGKRWGIETWHKVLKSGCQVEDCMLETAERLRRYLTLFSIIGVRLMHVTYLARVQPNLPAQEVFSGEEIEALNVRLKKALPAPTDAALTLKEMVRGIGSLGGHLGRKGDKEPGLVVLWRGWMRLYESVEALRAHKIALGLVNSS